MAMGAAGVLGTIVVQEYQRSFKDKRSPRAMLVSLKLSHNYEDPALRLWHVKVGKAGGGDWPTFLEKNKADTFAMEYGGEVVESYTEDYYPRAELLIWSPGNYTKVFVRERDIHHFGTGKWVKVHDHDSCWHDGVRGFIERYAESAYSVDSLDGWYKAVDIGRDETHTAIAKIQQPRGVEESRLPGEWGKWEEAEHLPAVTRGKVR